MSRRRAGHQFTSTACGVPSVVEACSAFVHPPDPASAYVQALTRRLLTCLKGGLERHPFGQLKSHVCRMAGMLYGRMVGTGLASCLPWRQHVEEGWHDTRPDISGRPHSTLASRY
jgi:hypothetical protein